MLRSGTPDLLLAEALPLLEMIAMDEYNVLQDFCAEIFNEEGSSQWGEQDTSFAGLGAVPEVAEGDSVSYLDPTQGYDKTYTHLSYKLGVAFSEEIVEDEKFGLIQKSYKSLGKGMHQTVQVVGISVLNSGFGDTGPDGSSLFNSSHGLVSGGSYGNRPSTDIALSVAGIREMDIDMINSVDHSNINVMIQPETIIVPPDLKHVALELLKSMDRPDTANRATNTIQMENYKLIVCPYLTSTSAWFALAPKSQHSLKKFNRVAPNMKSEQDFDSGDWKTRIRCRFSVGYSDWMGSWGTSPS